MENLGELGFWLAVGAVVAAWILSNGQKEREKHRQRQETLRTILTLEGKDTADILAYLRENDTAEQKREGDRRMAVNRAVRTALTAFAALVAAVAAFLVTVRVFNGHGVQPQSWQALVVLLAPFAVGALAAFFVYVLIRGKKNVPPPGA
jgi:hypothetical protein